MTCLCLGVFGMIKRIKKHVDHDNYLHKHEGTFPSIIPSVQPFALPLSSPPRKAATQNHLGFSAQASAVLDACAHCTGWVLCVEGPSSHSSTLPLTHSPWPSSQGSSPYSPRTPTQPVSMASPLCPTVTGTDCHPASHHPAL